ncbi:MAG: WYL domain-containing protein [Paludibacteraceae bacterium]|nr:WYL domain-containing protein [Paludibacteraceae bacterium]
MAAHQVNVFFWLLDTIASGNLTRDDINRRWANCRYNDNHETEFPERKFHRYKEELQEIFDVDIRCSKSRGNVYYIENKDDISGGTRQWFLNAMAVHSVMDQAKDITNCILYEDIPAGTQYLSLIVEAIRNRTQLQLTYHSFNRQEQYELTLSPYCLKVFKQRWYVAGCPSTHPNEIRVYALDRVQKMRPTNQNFIYPTTFDAHAFFAPYYGVFRNATPTKIIIEATPASTQFLRLLPLHQSQKELRKYNGNTFFEYYIAPTLDFIQELRTHGTDIRVHEPEALVEIFRQEAQKAYNMYCI